MAKYFIVYKCECDSPDITCPMRAEIEYPAIRDMDDIYAIEEELTAGLTPAIKKAFGNAKIISWKRFEE